SPQLYKRPASIFSRSVMAIPPFLLHQDTPDRGRSQGRALSRSQTQQSLYRRREKDWFPHTENGEGGFVLLAFCGRINRLELLRKDETFEETAVLSDRVQERVRLRAAF